MHGQTISAQWIDQFSTCFVTALASGNRLSKMDFFWRYRVAQGSGDGVGGGGDVKNNVGGELDDDDDDIPLSPAS